jgi:hypothetical protein
VSRGVWRFRLGVVELAQALYVKESPVANAQPKRQITIFAHEIKKFVYIVSVYKVGLLSSFKKVITLRI